MAEDFVLSMGLYMSAAEALNTLKDVGKSANQSGESIEDMGSSSELSMAKMGAAFAFLGHVATGVFDNMKEASPSLQVALLEIDLTLEELYRTLGEALAPVIEDVILPLIIQLVDWFMSLNEATQQNIAIIIGLVVAFTMLAPFVGGFVLLLNSGALPAILAVSAGLLLLDLDISKISQSLEIVIGWIIEFVNEHENFVKGILIGIIILTVPFAGLIILIGALFLAYKNNFGGMKDIVDNMVGEMVDKLVEFADNNDEQFGRIFEKIKELIVVLEPVMAWIFENVAVGMSIVFDFILEAFDGFLDIFEGLIEFFIGLFTWDTEKMGDGITQAFKGVVNVIIAIINSFIDVWNSLLDNIEGWDALPDWIQEGASDLKMTTLATFHDGGVIGGTGEVPIMALGGEEVLTEDDPRHIKNAGGTKSGGTVFQNTFHISVKAGMSRSELQNIGNEISIYLEKQAQLKGKF